MVENLNIGSDYRTRLSCSGVGRVEEVNDLTVHNGSKVITILLSFARRRQDAAANTTITEQDLIPVKFWGTGAEIINDVAIIGTYIHVELEVRSNKSGRAEFKAKHFDVIGDCK